MRRYAHLCSEPRPAGDPAFSWRQRGALGLTRTAGLGALLAGCNSILGIGSDYHLVPGEGCAESACVAGTGGISGGTGGGAGAAAGDGAQDDDDSLSGGGQGGSPFDDTSEGGDGGTTAPGGTTGGRTVGPDAPSTLGSVGEDCAAEESHGCADHAQQQRVVCSDGVWTSSGVCDAGSACDTSLDGAGTCSPVIEECAGKFAGFAFCRNTERFECGIDLVTADAVYTCPYRCSEGECAGECVPTTRDCAGGDGSGGTPRVCQGNGAWLDAEPCESLCREGACVDASCGDHQLNGEESDQDCGGNCGATCTVGANCRGNTDCVLPASGKCDASGKCVAASCGDGVKNGEETGTDCGGGCPTACDVGGGCANHGDCDASACVDNVCSGVCSPGEKKCSGNGVITCRATGEWSPPVLCVDQTCVGETCQGVCAPDQTGCDGAVPKTCGPTGNWVRGSVTTGACSATCTPGTTQCSGATREQSCNASGMWNPAVNCTNQTCVGTGPGSACQGVCAQGQTHCSSNGTGVESCTASGTWGPAATCPAPQTCQGGACACPVATPDRCGSDCTDFDTDRFNCGSCGHSCQGGSCSAGVCQPFQLYSPISNANGIAVSSTAVYWTTSSGGSVYTTPLLGDGGKGPSPSLASFGGKCGILGLTVDSTHLYGLVSESSCTLFTGVLKRVPLSGGTVTTLTSSVSGIPGAPYFYMTTDASNVYYTNYDTQRVYRVPKAGGDPNLITAAILAGAPRAITQQGGNLFWTATFGTKGVMKMATSGGSVVRLAEEVANASSIAADGTYVYYVSTGLERVPVNGGTPVDLAPDATGAFAIDASNVYFLGSSSVMAVPKVGGTVRTLASGQSALVAAIAVDNTSVYWLTSTAVMKVAL